MITLSTPTPSLITNAAHVISKQETLISAAPVSAFKLEQIKKKVLAEIQIAKGMVQHSW